MAETAKAIHSTPLRTASESRTVEREIDDEQLSEVSLNREAEARDWLASFFRTEGIDKTALARRLGLGKEGRTVVTKFLADKRDDEINFARITLATERLRAQVDGPEGVAKYIGFQETECVSAIWNQAKKVRDGHLLGAVVGPIGSGKTEALREFQRRARHDGGAPVRIVRCRTTMNLPSFVRKLAVDMGLVEHGGDVSTLHEQIVRRLSSYPEFLIFDEIDYLTYHEKTFHFLRDLYDETGTGILLSGQLYFLSYVWGRADFSAAKGDDKGLTRSGTLAPFADRLAVEVAPGLTDEEIVDICEKALNATLDGEASKKLIVYVDRNFRMLALMLRALRDMRLKHGRAVNQRMIEAAWITCGHIKTKQ